MANIKVSEMTEATVFDDGDYTMIVQANQSKKISKENMLNDINTNIGDLTNLETNDKSSIVNAINELVPTTLFENSSGSSASITLSDNANNYSKLYIETIGLQYSDYIKSNSIIVDNPNGKTISKTNAFYNSSNNQIYVVNPVFSISDTVISISNNQAGTVGANNAYVGSTNVIGITKVIGYK